MWVPVSHVGSSVALCVGVSHVGVSHCACVAYGCVRDFLSRACVILLVRRARA